MSLKKGEKFIDVSSYQPADLNQLGLGRVKSFIKVSEDTDFLSPNCFAQSQSSDVQGYYHFARFGGSVAQAQAEANFFTSNLPSGAKWLVCDYEDSASGSAQANTDAVLAFMDVCASKGCKPIYYSYAPYTLANIDYHQILAKYPGSIWIAAYPNYAVTKEPNWSVFPSLDGVRWYQFTSTYIAGGLDANQVLLDDDDYTVEEVLKKVGDGQMITIAGKGGGTPYAVVLGGRLIPMSSIDDIVAFQKAGAEDVWVSNDDFNRIERYLNAGLNNK